MALEHVLEVMVKEIASNAGGGGGGGGGADGLKGTMSSWMFWHIQHLDFPDIWCGFKFAILSMNCIHPILVTLPQQWQDFLLLWMMTDLYQWQEDEHMHARRRMMDVSHHALGYMVLQSDGGWSQIILYSSNPKFSLQTLSLLYREAVGFAWVHEFHSSSWMLRTRSRSECK